MHLWKMIHRQKQPRPQPSPDQRTRLRDLSKNNVCKPQAAAAPAIHQESIKPRTQIVPVSIYDCSTPYNGRLWSSSLDKAVCDHYHEVFWISPLKTSIILPSRTIASGPAVSFTIFRKVLICSFFIAQSFGYYLRVILVYMTTYW